MTCIIPYDLYSRTSNNYISIINHTGSGYAQSGVDRYKITNNVASAAIYSGSNGDVSSSSSIWVWYR